MGIFFRLVLGLCTLHLLITFSTVVNASRRPWTTAENRLAAKRRARNVNKLPIPITCRLGGWSSWTPCTSCTDKTFRFRYLEKPSQYGGTECVETLWDRLACPNTNTQCLAPDYCGESFTCKGSGRCVSQSLRCNGESDCDDFSDEDECTDFNLRTDKCSTLMPIPGAERGTQGYNILTGDFMDNVLDPAYFGGSCQYVYNGEWNKFVYDAFCENLHYNEDEKNYRKPYNYHAYRFVAEATSKGSQEFFNDTVSLVNARSTLSSSRGGVTIGVYHVEVGLSGSSESTFLSNLTKYNSKDLAFVRLSSKVQTALFKMRSDKLMLHEDFYFSLMELPEQYDFGLYSRFYNTFGTHYVTEGTLGGTLEYVVVINKTTMETSNIEVQTVEFCLGASFGLSKTITGSASLDLKAKAKGCEKEMPYSQDGKSGTSVIEDIVTLVKGGIIDRSAGLSAIRTPDTYRKWGASLKYNPALIEYETLPIYELVRLSTAADHLGSRIDNLKKSFDEYLRQFSPCRCAACKHNGIPVLSGTNCKCLCKSGFQGEACEDTLRADAQTDGAWSCWGAWSSCTAGWKTRTRSCDNPAPENGGMTCLGSSSQAQHC
ncbi:complement component C8 alpha chain [Mugil cephalus]|uniref:complement component C8 alpha chain n=1 Tax=Mugil cephalus TaxID=48193 RepID=UPI001FB68D68|nr:complement component C8 alpha chain [Mugil cephalus]